MVVAQLDLLDPEVRRDQVRGVLIVDAPRQAPSPALRRITRRRRPALRRRSARLTPGRAGKDVRGERLGAQRPHALPRAQRRRHPARDRPEAQGQYVSLTAHNDHVGSASPGRARLDPRPQRGRPPDGRRQPGARRDGRGSGEGPAHPRQPARACARPRPDSIRNGADDDGTGTVVAARDRRGAEPARRAPAPLHPVRLAHRRGVRPARLAAGSPITPPCRCDSIVAEIDEDMIGRGQRASTSAGGGPDLSRGRSGAKRLSREFGDRSRRPTRGSRSRSCSTTLRPPGHPLQYYCRADHYSYARYGIPAWRSRAASTSTITRSPTRRSTSTTPTWRA